MTGPAGSRRSAAANRASALAASGCAALALVTAFGAGADGPPYSPPVGVDHPMNVYWGDTHVHSSWSPDAGSSGNLRLSPEPRNSSDPLLLLPLEEQQQIVRAAVAAGVLDGDQFPAVVAQFIERVADGFERKVGAQESSDRHLHHAVFPAHVQLPWKSTVQV